jgi:hypothetical protein
VGLAGLALFSGAVWARTVAFVVVLASAVTAFAWIPWYPVWAVIVIAIDIVILWALVAHGRDIASARE